MKQLDDGTIVPTRCYIYLESFNNSNDLTLSHRASTHNVDIRTLTGKQFWELFHKATLLDAGDPKLLIHN